jgi:transposase
MGRFVEGEQRSQQSMLPASLDEYIDHENPIRVVDAFIGELDLAAMGFDGVRPASTGRPAYHPETLLKIYLYSYLNRIQSSRRLEREAGRNLELMWLTGRLTPDFKTIADFRKDNGPAIQAVCAHFIAICGQLGLFAHAVAAINGSKFKGVNARDRNFTKGKLKRRIEQVEASIERYLNSLDAADLHEGEIAEAKTARLGDKITAMKQQLMRLQRLEADVLAAPDQQISLTDPDARAMATSMRGSGVVGYNVQAAVDTEHHLVVAHDHLKLADQLAADHVERHTRVIAIGTAQLNPVERDVVERRIHPAHGDVATFALVIEQADAGQPFQIFSDVLVGQATDLVGGDCVDDAHRAALGVNRPLLREPLASDHEVRD